MVKYVVLNVKGSGAHLVQPRECGAGSGGQEEREAAGGGKDVSQGGAVVAIARLHVQQAVQPRLGGLPALKLLRGRGQSVAVAHLVGLPPTTIVVIGGSSMPRCPLVHDL